MHGLDRKVFLAIRVDEMRYPEIAEKFDISVAEVESVLPAGGVDEPPSELKAARDKAEREAILAMLQQCQWNVTEASRRLGMDRGYLHRKIKRYGLARESAGS